ncbi:hypothetical protein OVN20_06930 [Microcella daejeonensis]|jgi:hypothetical protein|uniref:hypothetical protein n=1 Tax=Microcella daejeonensis TaxID=2994971 RepID=UPI00226E1AF6|nr:hypothetical protein [Microcella daejeonensis]WAB82851.1 hypothetical protein OVN20_06930 [Microcella daejeonensis]
MMMTEMMSTIPAMAEMDMQRMQAAMDACAACEQACTMCGDACGMEGMGRCASMCASTADMAGTMMRVMMRPAGMHAEAMSMMLQTTAMMMRACAEECSMHAEMAEHCRLCAKTCLAAAEACDDMRMAMTPA